MLLALQCSSLYLSIILTLFILSTLFDKDYSRIPHHIIYIYIYIYIYNIIYIENKLDYGVSHVSLSYL